MTTTTSSTPTIPTDWSPTAPGCLQTSNIWQWSYDNIKDARTVFGGPSQTTLCFPPTWAATGTYIGSSCPVLYTSACQGADSAVTCCPDSYNFECVPTSNVQSDLHGSQFRCISAYTDTGTLVVTGTALNIGTQYTAIQSMKTSLHLYAIAIVYITEVCIPLILSFAPRFNFKLVSNFRVSELISKHAISSSRLPWIQPYQVLCL